MLRQIQPEFLDQLPCDDREAIGSRRDLARINAVMGNWRWLARMLRRHAQPGDRVLELGAGRGEFLSWWSRFDSALAGAVAVRALDRAPRPEQWPEALSWEQTDLVDYEHYDRCDVVIANLVLHHCDQSGLATLGRRLAGGPRVVIASEPARRRRHVWQARLLAFLGVNRVTRHDAVVSVRAGFRGRELPALLGFEASTWKVDIATNWRGAYRMTAVRREAGG
jgi:SAM-dependent methyltransferase